MVETLELWQGYTREQVHDIFAPDTPFQPQSGSWGISGIVSIPERTADWVFFVTGGASQAGHHFDESITPDGILTWQSQPKQRLDHRQIRSFIEHDHQTHSIHLFMRSGGRSPYTYLGELAYYSHDGTREQPVHFRWQLLDWPPPPDVADDLGVTIGVREPEPMPYSPGLLQVDPPIVDGQRGAGSRRVPNRVVRSQPDRDARNAELGRSGELLVLRHEAGRLRAVGRADLADDIVHVAHIEGDAAGYDIRSFRADGAVRYIEVKTTRGPAARAFFASPNEVRFSQDHAADYVLVRVFAYESDPPRGRFYEIAGSLRDHYDLTPSQFRMDLRERATHN